MLTAIAAAVVAVCVAGIVAVAAGARREHGVPPVSRRTLDHLSDREPTR